MIRSPHESHVILRQEFRSQTLKTQLMQSQREIKIDIRQSDPRMKMCFLSSSTIAMSQKLFQNQNINWLKDLDHSNYLLNLLLQNFIQTQSIFDMSENLLLIFEVVVFSVVRDDIIMSITVSTINDIKCFEDINSLSNSTITLNSQSVFIESSKSIDASTIDNENESDVCHDFNLLAHEQSTYTVQSLESQIVDSNATMTTQLFDNILFETLKVHVEVETSNENLHFKLNASNSSLIDCDQSCHFIAAFFHAKIIESTTKFASMNVKILSSLSKYIDDNTFVVNSENTKSIEVQSLKYNNNKLNVATTTKKFDEVNVCDDSISIIENMSNNIFTSKRRMFVDVNMKSIKCIKKIIKREIKSKWKVHSTYTTLTSNKAINVRWFERR